MGGLTPSMPPHRACGAFEKVVVAMGVDAERDLRVSVAHDDGGRCVVDALR